MSNEMDLMPWHMSFTVFIVDPRPFAELWPILDEMFGARFEQDAEYKLYGSLRYTASTFGLALSCEKWELWEEGSVYGIHGGNEGFAHFGDTETKGITFHALKLLEGAELLRTMTFEEFREESRRREPLRGITRGFRPGRGRSMRRGGAPTT